MNSFFFGTHTFLSLCWARKSMSLSVHVFVTHTFFGTFFGTHTFCGTIFGPKKLRYFFEPVLFLAQCLARKNEFSFLLEPIFFWQNVWPEHV